MIGVNLEGTRPQIWTPMTHRFDETDELPFIGRQLGMLWCNHPAEEGDRSTVHGLGEE